MKIGIYKDEWYPVYNTYPATTGWVDKKCEISEERFEYYEKVFAEFNQVQQELRELYEKS